MDLNKYNLRNPNKATQTDMIVDSRNYSSATSNRSIRTAIEGNEDRTQERQASISIGDSMDDIRYRTRMSIADDLAIIGRMGGNMNYYTDQRIGQGMNMAVDVYNWWKENDKEDEEVDPPIDEEIFAQTQGY